MTALVGGSSPLARGKRERETPDRVARGLIPARAGKTRAQVCDHSGPPAHPRSRGENVEVIERLAHRVGSSPLARGKLLCAIIARLRARLIPARAGKTSLVSPFEFRGAAHPRSRGENAAAAAGYVVKSGSSPLARGKRSVRPTPGRWWRLIPARAGKTCRTEGRGLWIAAHPRSRGENHRSTRVDERVVGSSPLARGKQGYTLLHGHDSRLIPARAGKT